MVRTIFALEQLGHGRDEIIGNRAADAAIGKLNDIVFRAGFCAAALQHVAVDAEIAELVDDERNALAIGVLQQIADHRRLAGTEEAGDDGRRDLALVGSGSGHGSTLHFQRQSGRDKVNFRGFLRNDLVKPAGMVAEIADHAVLGHDAEADFVGNKDEARPRLRQESGKGRELCRHVAPFHHQVGDPQRQAVDEHHAVLVIDARQQRNEVERLFMRRPAFAAPCR